MREVATRKTNRIVFISSICVVLILSLLALTMKLNQGGPIISEVFNTDSAMKHIEELTKDKYEGRLVGSLGNDLAAQYIEEQFRTMGLKPVFDDSYSMTFRTIKPVFIKEPYARISLGDGQWIDLKRGIDFKERIDGYSGGGEIESEIVYISNYKDLEAATADKIQDKIVLLNYLEFKDVPLDKIDYYIHMRRSLGIMYLHDPLFEDHVALGSKLDMMLSRKIVKLGVTKDVYDKLYEAVINNKKPSTQIGVFIDFEENVPAKNVGGYIPGEGVFKDEIIIVTANFDGLGTGYNEKVYQGANKNASGVGVLLELANSILNNGTHPKKTIVFLALNGHEMGSTGVEYFLRQKVFLNHSTKVINLDSLGGSNLVLTTETYKTPYLKGLPLFANTANHFLHDDNSQGIVNLSIPNLDHVRFIAKGIPAITIKGMQKDYMPRVEDRLDKISRESIENSGTRILDLLNHQIYDVKVLPYLIPPLIKTIPLLLILAALLLTKEMIIRGRIKVNNWFVRFIKNKSLATPLFILIVIFYMYSFQAYFVVQRDLGIYLLQRDHYTYLEILKYIGYAIFPVAIMIVSQATVVIFPLMLWGLIYMWKDKVMPQKVFVSVSLIIMLILDYIMSKALCDPATRTVMPVVLRGTNQHIILTTIIFLVSSIGALIYYIENRHKDINPQKILVAFATVNLLVITFYYSPYFADKAANEIRGWDIFEAISK